MNNLIMVGGDTISGAEIVLRDYLEETELDFILLTSKKIEQSNFFCNQNKVIGIKELSALGSVNNHFKKFLKVLYLLFFTLKLNKIIKDNNIKNIITNNTGDIFYLTFLKKNEVKVFSYIHDMIEENSIFSKVIKLNDKKIDKYIVVSEASKKSLEKIGLQSKKILTIYNGMGLKEFKKKEKIENKFIFIGNLDERKNPLEFLWFLEKMSLKNISYEATIIYKYFDNEVFEKVSLEIKKKNLNVNLYKELKREQVDDLINEQDFLFICSKKDPLPTVVLEAMSNSVPVIGKNIDGISEMVINGENGFIYEKREELDAVIDKITKISVEEYNKLRLNANKKIELKFDNKNKVKKLDSLFKIGDL